MFLLTYLMLKFLFLKKMESFLMKGFYLNFVKKVKRIN